MQVSCQLLRLSKERASSSDSCCKLVILLKTPRQVCASSIPLQSFENGARDAYQEFRYPYPIDNSELIRATFWVVDMLKIKKESVDTREPEAQWSNSIRPSSLLVRRASGGCPAVRAAFEGVDERTLVLHPGASYFRAVPHGATREEGGSNPVRRADVSDRTC